MKTAYQRRLACALGSVMLTLGLAACGPAPGPGGAGPEAGPGQPRAESFARPILKYGDELVDLSTYPEPPPNKAGGMPPEDLTATPKPGGFVRITASGPDDAHFSCCGSTTWAPRVFASGLLRWDLRCNCPQPDLAESWTVASDALSYDFKLRTGVKWQNLPPVNGRDVTAEDIKWSLDRVSGLRETPGKQTPFKARYDTVKEFQIVNPTTLRMVMKQPDVQILAEVMHDYMIIFPKEAAIDGGYSQVKSLIGSGPFQVEYGEPGGNWKLVRNPTFWEKDKAGRQLPYLDGIQTLGAADDAAKIAGFKSRQVDMVTIRYHPGRPLLGDSTVRYVFQRGLATGAIGFFMNVSIPPFNDIRARRAINLALDRDELIQAQFGDHDAGFVPGFFGAVEPWHWSEAKLWSMPGYARGEAKKQEIEVAKRLLAEAGYGNGFTLTVSMQDAVLYEPMQFELKKVGITTKLIDVGAGGKYASTTKETGRQLFQVQQGGGHTPDNAYTAAYLCDAVQNISLYCNPEIDKLFFEERRTRETDKRMAMILKMQDLLWEDMPMAPGIRTNTILAAPKYVRGWRNSWYDLQFSQAYQMAYTWLDK